MNGGADDIWHSKTRCNLRQRDEFHMQYIYTKIIAVRFRGCHLPMLCRTQPRMPKYPKPGASSQSFGQRVENGI